MKSSVFIKVLVLSLLIVNGDLFSAAQDDYSKDIFNAVEADDVDAVSGLLEGKADVNQRESGGRSLLYYAVEKQTTKMAELLLRSGAKINSSDGLFGCSTPLHRAAISPNASMVRLLLDQKADPNKRSLASTPLTAAVGQSTSEVVALLLERKANPNDDDDRYSYSLYKAVENANFAGQGGWSSLEVRLKDRDDKIKIVELLIEAGANPNLSRYLTPYQERFSYPIATPRIREVMAAAIAKKKASDAAAGQLAAQEEKD